MRGSGIQTEHRSGEADQRQAASEVDKDHDPGLAISGRPVEVRNFLGGEEDGETAIGEAEFGDASGVQFPMLGPLVQHEGRQ